jgi:hypothetical protein
MTVGEDRPIDPRRPHPFRVADEGIAAVMSGSWSQNSQANLVGGTAAFRRSLTCGVPGCGRSRTDDIHATAEDPAES